MDNIEDDYRIYIQKSYDTAIHSTYFCEMLIGVRKYFFTLIRFSMSLISGEMFKIIPQSLKVYFTKWC